MLSLRVIEKFDVIEHILASLFAGSLGTCFQFGIGTEVDYFSAAKLYHKAADKGDRSAQFNLALMMINAIGIERDMENSAVWLQRASELDPH